MNSKITLARLAQMVSAKSGVDLSECEDVLRQLFKRIASCLESGENIRIKGFGTFKISAVEARKSVDVTSGQDNEIPAHNRIVFVPSKELAAAVNAPFDMFETIVVEEGILEEELIQAESEPDNLMTTTLRQQLILEEEKEDNLKKEYPRVFADAKDVAMNKTDDNSSDLSSSEPTSEPDEANSHDDSSDSQTISIPEDIADPSSDTTDEVIPDDSENSHRSLSKPRTDKVVPDSHEEAYEVSSGRKVWPWFIVAGVVFLVIGCGLLWWLNDDFSNWGKSVTSKMFSKTENPNDSVEDLEVATLLDNEDNLAEETSDQTGLVEEEMQPTKDPSIKSSEYDITADETVPTQASDKKKATPTTDTVSPTRYLTTIAKEHYGNFHLWPYIYKENEKILGHPNRIKPGTEVIVPDLAKYGVDPKNPDDIAKAKKLGVEIYKKYK